MAGAVGEARSSGAGGVLPSIPVGECIDGWRDLRQESRESNLSLDGSQWAKEWTPWQR